MKIFAKQDAHLKIKLDSEQLIEQNIRVRKNYEETVRKINSAKLSYDKDKLKAMEEFDKFVKDITKKKSLLLEELAKIEQQIEQKKELYYSLITKQDLLEEKMYQMQEKERKLDIRESYVGELEKNFNNKAYGRTI